MSTHESLDTAGSGEGWFRDGLRTQLRVVGALILREARTRYGRTQLGYLWAVAEPLGQVAFLAVVFSAINRQAPFGSSMILFFASGVLPMQLFTHMSRLVGTAQQSNEPLLFIPLVKPIDTMIARAALEIATSVLIILITIPTVVLILDLPWPYRGELVALSIAGLGLVAFGIGVINSTIGHYFASWKQIYDVLSRPLMLLSGVFFLPENMPPPVRELLSYLPTTQGIELFRMGLYEGYRSSLLDVSYLFEVGLGLTLIGLAAERVHRMSGE